ncbi:MAG: hypothetical protein ACLRSW_07210 [Christensenellaceae bacterium]
MIDPERAVVDKDDQGAPDFARSLGGGAVKLLDADKSVARAETASSMHPLYMSAGAGVSAGALKMRTGNGRRSPRDGAFGKPLLRLRRL